MVKAAPMTDRFTTALPGLLEQSVEALLRANITTPEQLVGHFLVLRSANFDVRQHCYTFWYWMHTCGITPLQRAYIMDYVGDAANRVFPGTYDPSVFAE